MVQNSSLNADLPLTRAECALFVAAVIAEPSNPTKSKAKRAPRLSWLQLQERAWLAEVHKEEAARVSAERAAKASAKAARQI